jgi:hypothetical protein
MHTAAVREAYPPDMNFAVCPDDGARLRAAPGQRLDPGRPPVLTCPTCGERFRLSEDGIVAAPPEDSC